jgi:catechol 2,3-dioxygenase-like lactoylglutathione lyase family enzyme
VDARISLVTLGVRDLARARAFYEALGWRGQEVEQTVFFQAGPLAVVLWSRAALADDAGVSDPPSTADVFGGTALAQNVRSRAEVDAALAEVVAAGGTVTRPAADTFYGGYAGYFRDPDGHTWEVAWNPGFHLAEDGSLVLPDFGS